MFLNLALYDVKISLVKNDDSNKQPTMSYQ